MEIAFSGYSSPFDSAASASAVRQRQQDAQRQSQGANQRASENQSRQKSVDSGPANRSRVINGEVLSSETVRLDARQSQTTLTRSSVGQQSSGEPDSRQVSAQQAIQNFQQIENLVPQNNEQRQVSGIIDTFV